MTSIDINYDQVRRLAAAFVRVPTETLVGARAVVQRGALNIKQDWQGFWAGHAHSPSIPSAITYDTRAVGPIIDAEIGVVKSRRQGGLGNILEFGTRNNAPYPGGLPALQREVPRFEAAIRSLTDNLP